MRQVNENCRPIHELPSGHRTLHDSQELVSPSTSCDNPSADREINRVDKHNKESHVTADSKEQNDAQSTDDVIAESRMPTVKEMSSKFSEPTNFQRVK